MLTLGTAQCGRILADKGKGKLIPITGLCGLEGG